MLTRDIRNASFLREFPGDDGIFSLLFKGEKPLSPSSLKKKKRRRREHKIEAVEYFKWRQGRKIIKVSQKRHNKKFEREGSNPKLINNMFKAN